MTPLEVGDIPWYLEPLTGVVALLASPQGELLWANQAFFGSAQVAKSEDVGSDATLAFIEPSFSSLASLTPGGDRGLLFQGPIILRGRDGSARCLKASAWRRRGTIVVVAEPEVPDLDQLTRTVLQLHTQIEEMHADLLRRNMELRRNEEELLRLVLTDPLTGLSNRRHFDERLRTEVERNRRYGCPLSVTMADVDRFKLLNDTYGHEAGDAGLKVLANILREHTRPTDLVVRYGGDEFMVLLPETGMEGAQIMAERSLQQMSADTAGLPCPVTASFGVATLERDEDAPSLLKRVDRALYQSKHRGRCQVSVAEPIGTT